MASVMPEDVMVVSLGEALDPALWQLARERGWTVIVADSLPDALKQTFARQPRVYLAYIDQAFEDGLQLIRALRSRATGVPVIAVSHAYDREMEKALRLVGASNCVFEPGDPQQLLSIIACKADAVDTPRHRLGRMVRRWLGQTT
jgi:DNA-binding response OmpR family regulator